MSFSRSLDQNERLGPERREGETDASGFVKETLESLTYALEYASHEGILVVRKSVLGLVLKRSLS